jgi:hypothetical protein
MAVTVVCWSGWIPCLAKQFCGNCDHGWFAKEWGRVANSKIGCLTDGTERFRYPDSVTDKRTKVQFYQYDVYIEYKDTSTAYCSIIPRVGCARAHEFEMVQYLVCIAPLGASMKSRVQTSKPDPCMHTT